MISVTEPLTAEDFNQIFRLNYKTFVEEIPQHQQNEQSMLVDKFHDKNRYLIAKRDSAVVGMISYCTERPFSLDAKLQGLDNYLPFKLDMAEIRLLAVEKESRFTAVTFQLFRELAIRLIAQKIFAAVISGTTRQLNLYRKIGFVEFGPLVGTADALYQPMYITINQLKREFQPN